MIIRVLGILLFFFLGYNVLPNYYVRNISKGVIHTLSKKGKYVALTFDDGPDEKYTGQVLDILKTYRIKATFFVVASKIPDQINLIERMKKEGHKIGLHTFKHKSAWLMGPIETFREIPKSKKILEAYDIEIAYYRPPWGTFNLFTLISAKRNKLKTIFWSVEAYDWRKNNSAESISEILIRRIKDQSIVVLHDSGGAPEAPMHTIGALKQALPKLLEQGYEFVVINE
jgi:peptidoglycan/xylan/chitin deacetylase (PgdA/CDA1 family)